MEDEDAEEAPEEMGMKDEDEEEAEEIAGMDELGDEPEEMAMKDEDEEEAEEDLDLEAVIRELETELAEGEEDDDDDEPVSEGAEDKDNAHTENAEGKEDPKHGVGTKMEAAESDDDDVEIDESIFYEEDLGNGKPEEADNAYEEDGEADIKEQSTSSGIGKGDNKGNYASASDEEDPQGGKPVVGVKMESVQAELKEYKEAVKFLKDKLHEVNILNAKLLFTNKLFKSYSLNNNQKLKVVETFDRAQTTREIKLVYSTLAEQFGDNGSIKRKNINESASASIGSTKPSKGSQKVISEADEVANRFRKLAGIIKG